MPDFIPGSDPLFDGWQGNLAAYLAANAAALGLTPAEVAPITAASLAWGTDFAANTEAHNAARAARIIKDESRAEFERLTRPLIRRLQASDVVSNAERAAMGITVPRSGPPTPTSPPTTRPLAIVSCGERLTHRLRLVDEGESDGAGGGLFKRARPQGVHGAELWRSIGTTDSPVPSDPGNLAFVGTFVRMPAVVRYAGADGGKTAHYRLRWMSRLGDPGPWSDTVSATIAA